MNENDFKIRPAANDDLPFLREMLFEAAAVSEEIRRIGRGNALALPFIARYLENWGRPHDFALVAETGEKVLVGASWFRLFPGNDRGFGFVSAEIPELTVAVVERLRGRGVGSKLLEELIEAARKRNFPALSLSVNRKNPAMKLYEKFGFRDAGFSRKDDSSVTMILTLAV